MTDESKIPYPKNIELTKGAAKYLTYPRHCNTPYYTHLDFYNMHSTNTLTILSHFKTYQQTQEYTCGPAVALMLLYYYLGNSPYNEMELAEIMRSNQDINGNNTESPGEANEEDEYGTTTDRLVSLFTWFRWNVQSSLTYAYDDGKTFQNVEELKKWVLFYLNKGIPILVEWIDLGGHWQIIIGYDTMGTEAIYDDVLILADPYDITDHIQDGYYVFPVQRFYEMWVNAVLFPKEQKKQQWIIATPWSNIEHFQYGNT